MVRGDCHVNWIRREGQQSGRPKSWKSRSRKIPDMPSYSLSVRRNQRGLAGAKSEPAWRCPSTSDCGRRLIRATKVAEKTPAAGNSPVCWISKSACRSATAIRDILGMSFLIVMIIGLAGLFLMALPGLHRQSHVGTAPRDAWACAWWAAFGARDPWTRGRFGQRSCWDVRGDPRSARAESSGTCTIDRRGRESRYPGET